MRGSELPQRLAVKDVADVMRFLRKLGETFGAFADQGVELLGRFPEDLHGDGIPLRAVLDLAEGIDAIPVNILRIP